MKVKILGEISYATYPITKDMIDIDENDLKEIGKTKKFENGQVVSFEFEPDNTDIILIKQQRLAELTKDLAQVQVGLIIDDLEDRKTEFRTLLNEVRMLQGKQPREIKESDGI